VADGTAVPPARAVRHGPGARDIRHLARPVPGLPESALIVIRSVILRGRPEHALLLGAHID
jgi:hypothetical protein